MKKILLLLLLFIAAGFTILGNNVDGLTIEFRKISEDYVLPGATPVSAVPSGQTVRVPGRSITIPTAGAPNTTWSYEDAKLAHEGMIFVKLKLTFKNEGTKDCVFDLKDTYMSTEQDSLYPFHSAQGYFINTKTRIKPQKEIDRILIFEFPEKANPKELFIEDKRYTVVVSKEKKLKKKPRDNISNYREED